MNPVLGRRLTPRQRDARFSCRAPLITCFVLLHFLFAVCCRAAELEQKTVEAFNRYVSATEARMDAELRPGGQFLWMDQLPVNRQQQLYDELRRGQLEIRQEKTKQIGKPLEIPNGMIHHWTGIVFVPGVSLERAISLLQDYDNHWQIYSPYVRRSRLLERKDDTFKVYFQFYRNSPRRVSFNSEFEVCYTKIEAERVASRAISTRIAELEQPDHPDSAEFPLGRGTGYLWRVNNYWRVEEKDGGVYIQVETIALSRSVPAIFAWFVNPLIRRVSRETLSDLLLATKKGLQNPLSPKD